MRMQAVESSAMLAVGYDGRRKRLRIVFAQGNAHEYPDVPREVYEALMNADSKGSYFNDEIRDRFEAIRID